MIEQAPAYVMMTSLQMPSGQDQASALFDLARARYPATRAVFIQPRHPCSHGNQAHLSISSCNVRDRLS